MEPLAAYLYDEISRLKEIIKEREAELALMDVKLENYAIIAELAMKRLLEESKKTVSVPLEGTVS